MSQHYEDQANADLSRKNLETWINPDRRFLVDEKLEQGLLIDRKIVGKVFIGCDLKNLQIFNCVFEFCDFDQVQFISNQWNHVSFRSCSFRKGSVDLLAMSSASFESCLFDRWKDVSNVFANSDSFVKMDCLELKAVAAEPILANPTPTNPMPVTKDPAPSLSAPVTRFQSLDL